MTTLDEVVQKLKDLHWDLDELMRMSQYTHYEDLSALDVDWTDPEELFLVDQLRAALGKLDEVNGIIQYLNAPIKAVGRLHKNEAGRFEMAGYEFHCGDLIEALISDPHEEQTKWIVSRIEHDTHDFYIVGYKDVALEGLSVRIR